jgi:hypothetical protein
MDRYKTIIKNVDQGEIPFDLESRVLARIHNKQNFQTKIKIGFFAFNSVLTASLIFVVGKYLIEIIAKTGFYEYVKLAFSGDTAVYAFWKELAYSLFESLPVISVIALLIVIALFVWSFANTYTYARKYSFLQA